MLKVKDFVPDIYYNESRDFQYFGRLYDIVFNSVKCNVDLMKEAPYANMESLLLNTYGYRQKSDMTNEVVKVVAKNLTSLFKQKGTTECITRLFTILATAEGIVDRLDIEVDSTTNKGITTLNVTLPPSISFFSISLGERLLNYLLPVGCLCQIQKKQITNSYGYIYTKEKTTVNEISGNRASTRFKDAEEGVGLAYMTLTKKTGDAVMSAVSDVVNVGDIRFSKVGEDSADGNTGE